MGSCFSKRDPSRPAGSSGNKNNFKSPGRTLGSAPPQPPQPQPQPRPVPSPAASPTTATIESASSSTKLVSPVSASGTSQSGAADAARQNAAAAALARAQKRTPTGKLGQSLQAQKAMTDQQVLSESSAQAVRQREADENVAALANN